MIHWQINEKDTEAIKWVKEKFEKEPGKVIAAYGTEEECTVKKNDLVNSQQWVNQRKARISHVSPQHYGDEKTIIIFIENFGSKTPSFRTAFLEIVCTF
ncbi:hypothetical protein [Synechococcus sp. PCC 6312]|uniref:hypothetical protein n=1 Tax=Synechococcus sp. (strain ATCC 27167 / PCC 6312) TaxID=195253 RepID=UPI00029EF8FB|nr:hypothetical protein [Synechococcus sp. PCC 6312]AFY61949.1 hypothetical protein Syn6312_2885 [Synechococcus sp. PCC 6312]